MISFSVIIPWLPNRKQKHRGANRLELVGVLPLGPWEVTYLDHIPGSRGKRPVAWSTSTPRGSYINPVRPVMRLGEATYRIQSTQGNILVDENGQACLRDFGVTQVAVSTSL